MAEYIERSKLEFDFRQCNITDFNWTPQRVLQMIHRQPIADVATVRRGNWIERVDNDTHMHECSLCGARVVKGLYEYENPNLYCYHCGARMDGDTNG